MTTQPLKWVGGKHYLAKRIIELMPEHTHYVEPFFGGGAVLFNKDPNGVSEVINDIDGELMNFWRVLRSEKTFTEFKRIIDTVPFSEADWQWAHEPSKDTVEKAVKFFIRCRFSRSGNMKNFAPLSRNRTRRGMNEQASAWMNVIDKLPEISMRLKRVVILNRPAIEVIKSQDGINTLFYLDPPYLHETRKSTEHFRFEMDTNDHIELLETIKKCDGKVMISGYDSELYNDILTGWHKFEFDIDNKMSGEKVKNIVKECVWVNY